MEDCIRITVEDENFDFYFPKEELLKLQTLEEVERHELPKSDVEVQHAYRLAVSHSAEKFEKEFYRYFPDKVLRRHFEDGEWKEYVFAGACARMQHYGPYWVVRLTPKLQATVYAVYWVEIVCFVSDTNSCCIMYVDDLFPSKDDDPNGYETFMKKVGGPFEHTTLEEMGIRDTAYSWT